MQASLKIVDVQSKTQLEPLLVENLGVVEEGMQTLDRNLPTAAGAVDIIAKDKNGAIVLIGIVDANDRCPIDKCLKCYGFIKSNKALFERFYQGIDSKKAPRLILIAQRFTETVVNIVMYNTLNVEGLFELKEYSVIQIPGGAQSIIMRSLDLTAIRNEKFQEKTDAVPLETPTNGGNGNDSANLIVIGKNTAMVAHDLKTPIQVLMNSSYNFRQDYESSDSVKKKVLQDAGFGTLLDTVDKQVDYINRMVTELQSLSAELKPKIAEVSLTELLKDVTAQVPANVKLSLEIVADMASYDYYMMKRALANVVTNALQAMPDGGFLSIKTATDGESTVVQIQDTGVGISKEVMQNLFSTFTTTKSNGTGMGLISAKRIIDAHKGTISVDSQVGKGTIVTIKIPRQK